MREELANLFDRVLETAEGFRANCPRCGDDKLKLYVNVEKRVGACFHQDCSWHPSKGGVTEFRLRAWMRKEGIHYTTTQVTERPKDADLALPPEYKLLDELEDSIKEAVYAYLMSRGLKRRTLQKMKVGYCPDGKFYGYIIFPVMDAEGKVIYWQARAFKTRKAKFYNPKASNKKEILYQIGGTKLTRSIVIVESIINALTLDNGVEQTAWAIIALLGKTMSEQQRQHILSYERTLREVTIALDPDAAREAVSVASQLSGFGFVVRIAQVPRGQDINSLGRLQAWERIERATVFNPAKGIAARSTNAPYNSVWLR